MTLLVLGAWLQRLGSPADLTADMRHLIGGIARLEVDHRRFQDAISDRLAETEVRVGVVERELTRLAAP